MLQHEVHRMDSWGPQKPVLSVTQLNAQARTLLERSFASVAVQGEIAGVKVDGAGHTWFCLKDRGGLVNAVLFRGNARGLRVPLKDGVQVVAHGRLTIYGPTGRYQFVVSHLEAQGEGALQAAFEALKAKLQAEGLFAAERKRRLPLLPRRVAVVTSPSGAVIRDIVHVGQRRFPNAQILVVPCRVQGEECAASVTAALRYLASRVAGLRVDTIIVARGGGSLADLWGFNSEDVARAIAASPVPVVSAVGHETDFTIADFVADVRAPTPSAAAELVFANKSDLTARLYQLSQRQRHATVRRLAAHRLRLRALHAELGDGKRPLLVQAQRLSHMGHRLQRGLRETLRRDRARLAMVTQRLHGLHPRVRLQHFKGRVQAAHDRVRGQAARTIDRRRQGVGAAMQRLHDLSPLAVLGRGYAIVGSGPNAVARCADEVAVGSRLHIRLAQGALWARVEEKCP